MDLYFCEKAFYFSYFEMVKMKYTTSHLGRSQKFFEGAFFPKNPCKLKKIFGQWRNYSSNSPPLATRLNHTHWGEMDGKILRSFFSFYCFLLNGKQKREKYEMKNIWKLKTVNRKQKNIFRENENVELEKDEKNLSMLKKFSLNVTIW